MSNLVVVKFGGSVLRDAESFRNGATYIIQRNGVALVSAMSGVTNEFMRIYENGDFGYLHDYPMDVYQKVITTLPPELKEGALQQLQLHDTRILQEYMMIGARDAFVGSPEGHSAVLLRYHIIAQNRGAESFTGPEAGFFLDRHGQVDVKNSTRYLRAHLPPILRAGGIPVVGGFLGLIGDVPDQRYKVGARNINDAFATAIAFALDAGAVEIIKDVPGVFRVPPEFGNYGLLEKLSYDEARKMSWRGSPVVHSSAIKIAQSKDIPIFVKDMKSKGTVISLGSQTTEEKPVAALVAERTHMITVRDEIMDTPESRGLYLARIYQFEADSGVDVGMIATDFGGVSYTIALGDRKRSDNENFLREYIERLEEQLNSYGYRPVIDGEEAGMITMVGDGMQYKPGVLSSLAGMLAGNDISIRASAQSDEKIAPPSITFVVGSDRLEDAVKTLAEQLFT